MQGQSHRLADLVDLERLRHVCDGLSAASGMVLAVLDPDGTILLASGWQDICTQFHRLNDETVRGCLESDTTMTRRLSEGVDAGSYSAYKCANGLWDVAFPLIIEGDHVASVFTGQFFYDDDEIDASAFRARARRLGFDETAYLEAMARVPVFSHQRVTDTIDFLGGFVGMLAETGLSALQQTRERDALQESEERYRQLFEAESDAVFLVDNETGRILEANSAAAAMYGYSQDELLAMTNEQLSAEPEKTQAVTHGTPVVADNVATIPLRIHRKKDGSTLPVEITGRFFLRHGRAVHLAAIRDISARLATEEALRLSEDKFAKAFHGTPDAILITRARDGRLVDVNHAFTTLSGHSRDAALAGTTVGLEVWAERGDRERVITALAAGGPVRDMDFDFRVKGGVLRQCVYSGAMIEVDGEPHVLSVVHDITEQRRTETAVKQSEALLRGILDNVQDAYVRTDLDGRVLMVSPSAARLYGFDSVDDMIGLPAESLYADRADRTAMFDQLRTSGQVADFIGRGLRKDGSAFWVSLNAQLFRDEEGNVAGTEGFVRDITERKEIEQEIRRLNAELEQRVTARTAELEDANRELEAFAYSVSHDLRAPLRALDGFSQILLEDYGTRLDEEGRSHLVRIRAADVRMTALIDGLLELSRLNRGELSRELLDLSEMARHAAERLAETDPARHVEFDITDGLEACADRRLVRALLANLMGNAWKFTAGHETARIEVGAEMVDGECVFSVRDDGAGFDMAYANKLFGAFQRLHSPGEFEGLGIGLATVQRIVRRHGGRVWAEGAVEKGATLFFTLPSASAA